jgi:hypothetical protein
MTTRRTPKSLPQVARACKELHELVIPILYRRIFIDVPRYALEKSFRVDRIFTRAQRYAKELSVICGPSPVATVNRNSQKILLAAWDSICCLKLKKLYLHRAHVNEQCYLSLNRILNDPECTAASNLRSSLIDLSLPTYLGESPWRSILDCKVSYRFQSVSQGPTRSVTVSAGGCVDTETGIPCRGTPLILLQKSLGTFGAGHEFEHIQVDVESKGHTVINALGIIHSGSITPAPYKVSSLILNNLDLANDLPMEIYQAIDFSTIDDLGLLDCMNFQACSTTSLSMPPTSGSQQLVSTTSTTRQRWGRTIQLAFPLFSLASLACKSCISPSR